MDTSSRTKSLKRFLAALVLLVGLCVSGIHEASGAHSDKHVREDCPVCFAVQAFHGANVPPPISIQAPQLAFVTVFHAQTTISIFVTEVLSRATPPTGPPTR